MAYRLEKEATGKTAIVIDGWNDGIAIDPEKGMNRMFDVNLNVDGEVSVGYPITTSAVSGATLGVPIARSTRYFPTYGTPSAQPTGSAQSYAMVDRTGQVFETTSITGTWAFRSTANTTISATDNIGLAYYLGYLFKFQGTQVYYWNNTTWAKLSDTTGADTITSDVPHFAYVASNNVLYFGNGNYLGAITPANPSTLVVNPDTFDPTNAATFIFNNQQLRLPVTDQVISIAEVGAGATQNSLLLIGGTQNAIYPWDKTSTSFNLPIYVSESYIKRMVSANQNAFIFCGNTGGRGRIYITNGSQANLFVKIPDYIFSQLDPYFSWGDAIFHRNHLLFGAFINPNSGGATLLFSEVYAINLDTKAFYTVSNIPAAATAKGRANCLIGAANPNGPGFSYMVGWDDNDTTPGIGYSGTTAGVGTASIITDLIPVGTLLVPRTFEQIEVKLRRALQSGESLVITPLSDLTSATNLTMNTVGEFSHVFYPLSFQASQWLQLQLALTGNSATGGVPIREIRIR